MLDRIGSPRPKRRYSFFASAEQFKSWKRCHAEGRQMNGHDHDDDDDDEEEDDERPRWRRSRGFRVPSPYEWDAG